MNGLTTEEGAATTGADARSAPSSSHVLNPASVLVVDDDANNRMLIRDALEPHGHHVTEAADGPEALELVRSAEPDVVLLDIEMPGMDGLEVCSRIKESDVTAAIPVILITGHDGREVRLEGIRRGANDFLGKPVDLMDLGLRVRNAAGMKRLRDDAEARYQRILELESLRDTLVHMVVHDLRSPLTAVLGNLQLLQMDVEGLLEGDAAEGLDSTLAVVHQLASMVTTILDVSRLEAQELEVNLSAAGVGALIGEGLEILGTPNRFVVDRTSDSLSNHVECDSDLVRRVIANMAGNAMKFSPEDEHVVLGAEDRGDSVRFTVSDRGPGIPEEYRVKIFEKFQQVEARLAGHRRSSGLGLTFCKLAVEAHGGAVGVEPRDGGGSVFWFDITKARYPTT